MRIHSVNLLIAILVSGLLAYGLTIIDANTLRGTLAVGSFLFFASTLGMAIGVTFDQPRTGVNARVLASSYFVLALGVQLVFAFGWFSQAAYIIATGLLFLSFVLFANTICSANQ